MIGLFAGTLCPNELWMAGMALHDSWLAQPALYVVL
jgi:hypothetical protein